MRALVLWSEATSANLGVRALAEGTEALLRRVHPDAEVEFQNYGHGSAPVNVAVPRSLLRERVTDARGLRSWIRRFDLVLDTRAGDSFADIYGLQRLFSMSATAEFARRCGVPVVLGPQTIGPFARRRARWLARRTLRTAAVVMARDPVSADCAAGLGRPVDVLTTDVVFALDPPSPDARHDVLLNVSGLLWQPGPHVDAERYRGVVRSLVAALTGRGRQVGLLAHVLESAVADNDVPVVRALGAELGLPVVVPTDLTDVRRAVAGAELVIGSRMHACLNALSVGTPAIPLAYSRKFAPLLDGLGWPHSIDLRSHPDPVGATLDLVDRGPELARAATLTRERARSLLAPAENALRALG